MQQLEHADQRSLHDNLCSMALVALSLQRNPCSIAPFNGGFGPLRRQNLHLACTRAPCSGEGIILTHMVPDLAKWQIRVGGVLLFGASERPFNHPGVDLDDPMCPKPEPGALRDGQIPSFHVKWCNLTVRIASILRQKHYRIDEIVLRAVQGPFRCSKKQFASYTIWPSGKIGHHMGQNHTLV